MKHVYKAQNTCCKIIEFDINDNIITNVKFLGGGCPGNLQAVPKLVEGMKAEDVIFKLGDVQCGMRGTSCAQELAKAVKEACELK